MDSTLVVTHIGSIPAQGTDTYDSVAFSDKFVIVTLHDKDGFEKYYAEGHQHPSENVTDTIKRMIARIEDEHYGRGYTSV